MKLTSNAGHSASSPGSSHGKRKEHVIARRINKIFIEQAKARGITCIDSTSSADVSGEVLSEQVSKANASKANIAVSHHLNAGGGTGFEVFHDDKSAKGKAFAERVVNALSEHYGMRNRGAKPDTLTHAGSLYWNSRTAMPSVLIEWGFIDSDDDMAKILGDITGGVDAVLDALGVEKAADKPAKAASSTPKKYLKLGDRGEDVKKLQLALRRLGYKDRFGQVLKADGVFGNNTRHALVDFQRANMLKVDGIAGVKTLAALK